ncbi:hypothetical protein [Plastoroseomonas arctica]|uniref:Uncharacterized protein n=1 Tax=Plastoroseomonas arctica TaxID=1509237 RepID=A0AAF1JVC6_9PROT|nr:hypothetical protein [Plastoroseomonas arctica]MBR0653927.1 hypothetical protein [Plastoroseomonas arctica]
MVAESQAHSVSLRTLDEDAPPPLAHYPDPAFVAAFLAGMPVEVAASFSARQLFAIQQAFGAPDAQRRRKRWRASVPTPWATYTMSLAWDRG